MTEKTAKPTALFFGFLSAAMTYASAQAAPVQPQGPAPTAVERLMSDCGVTARPADPREGLGSDRRPDAKRAGQRLAS